MNQRPAWAMYYFRLRLKDKKRGKFLHILKMETKETPERTKATGITTQDLQQEGVHTALKSIQTDSVHLSHKLPEAPPSTEGQLCPPCLDPARWRISRRLPALTCSTFFFSSQGNNTSSIPQSQWIKWVVGGQGRMCLEEQTVLMLPSSQVSCPTVTLCNRRPLTGYSA